MRFTAFLIAAIFAAPVCAKLPPPTEADKAKAADIAAKNAWTDKVGLYQLCRRMDRIAADYRSSLKAAGKDIPASIATAPCVDPGPYVAPLPPAQSKPLETTESHSPAETAITPPSTKASAAETSGHIP